MGLVKCLRILARALDWAKDPDPSHWRTINGAKVHLDENGNYDGGAGGRFNGKHHYGAGYKEKQTAPPRRSAEEIVRGANNPNVKGLSDASLRDRMNKATSYRDWNQARGEIHRRLKERERKLALAFNDAAGRTEQDALREKLQKQKDELRRFEAESRIPYRFTKESFEHDPQAAENAYKNNRFLNKEVRSDYEKWKAQKGRTASIMQNLANNLKTEAAPPRPKTTRRKGTISDRFIDFIKHQISIDLSKYRDREYERRGHVNILIQQMPKKEKMEFYRFASQHKDDFTVLENGGLGIAIVPKKDGRWNK